MSNKRNLSPKRATQYAVFQGLKRQQRAASDAIWTRADGKCEVCRRSVARPGTLTTPAFSSVLVFDDSTAPTAESGRLLCRRCYRPPVF